MRKLNEVFTSFSMRRRYEVWFLRMGLADQKNSCWLRYLIMNPATGGCGDNPGEMPVQVWATWFAEGRKPQTLIQGYTLNQLDLSKKGARPFHFRVAQNEIGEDFCKGLLASNGHTIQWNLQYNSTFHSTLSNKGWIGFSRSPHSDAVFSGEIDVDGHRFSDSPLGFGVQGHNCGYRHRKFWRWTHCYFRRPGQPASTLEALVYEMPMGLIFRKALLWHEGKEFCFRKMREHLVDRDNMRWRFSCFSQDGLVLEVAVDGSGPSIHRVSYLRTNCLGTFEVSNNSSSSARIVLRRKSETGLELSTNAGAVLELVG